MLINCQTPHHISTSDMSRYLSRSGLAKNEQVAQLIREVERGQRIYKLHEQIV